MATEDGALYIYENVGVIFETRDQSAHVITVDGRNNRPAVMHLYENVGYNVDHTGDGVMYLYENVT